MNIQGEYAFETLKKHGAFLCLNKTDINGKAYSKKFFGSTKIHEYRSLDIQMKTTDAEAHKNKPEFMLVSNRESPRLFHYGSKAI